MWALFLQMKTVWYHVLLIFFICTFYRFHLQGFLSLPCGNQCYCFGLFHVLSLCYLSAKTCGLLSLFFVLCLCHRTFCLFQLAGQLSSLMLKLSCSVSPLSSSSSGLPAAAAILACLWSNQLLQSAPFITKPLGFKFG